MSDVNKLAATVRTGSFAKIFRHDVHVRCVTPRNNGGIVVYHRLWYDEVFDIIIDPKKRSHRTMLLNARPTPGLAQEIEDSSTS